MLEQIGSLLVDVDIDQEAATATSFNPHGMSDAEMDDLFTWLEARIAQPLWIDGPAWAIEEDGGETLIVRWSPRPPAPPSPMTFVNTPTVTGYVMNTGGGGGLTRRPGWTIEDAENVLKGLAELGVPAKELKRAAGWFAGRMESSMPSFREGDPEGLKLGWTVKRRSSGSVRHP